ncbi:IclR family transcriptional regulator [Georgenia sp. TF02-10]|uniref:IclR family transcriptional regulator n=1 Tax=Georgenia sp. TF02-10 TaxID=2917725 RepID=UPI001FA6B818|nr:IclR family transcriptional regulator [Georgenia sp. TF02-10]UNX55598.1 IclR family transcriptional regulator [Georgenia sp. TF02-10]
MAAPTPRELAAVPGDAPSSAVKSAARTLQLLELLADRGGVPARLAELADELGAPRSSVHALLRTLSGSGWVRTDPTGTLYAIGLRCLLVGTSILDSDPYLRVARPVLAALRDRLGETVHLARLDGDRVVYLTTHESGREPRRIARVGRGLPAHATSLGKALLAERGDAPAGPLAAVTHRTITAPADLTTELERTRRRGYAIDNEENTPGLCCLGVALRYTRPVLDAISCSVPVDRMTEAREAEVAAALLEARAQIEESAPVQGVF